LKEIALKKDLIFYIYAPDFRSNSAGIKVLHLLAKKLLENGQNAFLVISNPEESKKFTHLNVPILDQKTSDEHVANNQKIIAIYSETVVGNPLRADNVVRYFLNFPGALGGALQFHPAEIYLAYSKSIASELDRSAITLFIPAVDLSELPHGIVKEPNLNLVYAGKYRAFMGKPNFPSGISLTEIFRDGPGRQDRQEVLRMLAAANRLYLWENSTIATEAILLGTPVIFIRSKFLQRIIAESELGKEGWTFELSEAGIDKARSSLPEAKQKYHESQALSDAQIRFFLSYIYENQKNLRRSEKKLKIPTNKHLINKHRIRMFIAINQNLGPVAAVRVTKQFGYFRAANFRNKVELRLQNSRQSNRKN
jgi:O-antigen biosynthesis protein